MTTAPELFETYASHYPGMPPSVLFMFKEAERASSIWRFNHKVHTTKLRIFADSECVPIGIQFRNIDLSVIDESDEESIIEPISEEKFAAQMFRFAKFMVEYGQLEQGLELFKDATHELVVPDSEVTDVFYDRARDAACITV